MLAVHWKYQQQIYYKHDNRILHHVWKQRVIQYKIFKIKATLKFPVSDWMVLRQNKEKTTNLKSFFEQIKISI